MSKYTVIRKRVMPTEFWWSVAIAFAVAMLLVNNTYAALPGMGLDRNQRLLVLTDIDNEPDDQMSLVRLLVYSNEIDIESLIATTSTWKRNKVNEKTITQLINAYGSVRPNLLKHAPAWPTAQSLVNRVSRGQPDYGMAAVGKNKTSDGAHAIIKAVDRIDERPLWISIWGGANTLAQALFEVRASRTSDQLADFIRKIRVYSISDQDDAGPWIRKHFPALFYIVRPTTPDNGEYVYSTWTGISGDVFYQNCQGADGAMVTNTWLDKHIRSKGELGALYPQFDYIMEGDTPSFLGLISNGLASYHSPSWGGWGGRYIYRKSYGESRPLWTQGGGASVSSRDAVKGTDGKTYISDQATIWRWRNDFQQDFAARMDWTIKDYSDANHNPEVIINGKRGVNPIELSVDVGGSVVLDAKGSSDPDNNTLSYTWFHYPEAGFEMGQGMAEITLQALAADRVRVVGRQACKKGWHGDVSPCNTGIAHIILRVQDSGTPTLTRYRRIILTVKGGDK